MKIHFHYTYIIMALGFTLSGYITNLLIFTTIILVHELGHFLMAKINKFKVDIIMIYPYGGLTKLDISLNEDINKELTVALSGIIMQLLLYILIFELHKYYYLRDYIFNLYKEYNRNILLFNLLPIIPLDGSKMVNLLLFKVFPYKISNKITIILSYITLIILLCINYYQFNYTMIMTITILLSNISKYYHNINNLFYRFLLERYLYNYKYNTYKIIKKEDNMYKNKSHLFYIDKRYYKEEDYIKRLFLKK